MTKNGEVDLVKKAFEEIQRLNCQNTWNMQTRDLLVELVEENKRLNDQINLMADQMGRPYLRHDAKLGSIFFVQKGDTQ